MFKYPSPFLVFGLVLLCLFSLGCEPKKQKTATKPSLSAEERFVIQVEPKIESFCGYCHPLPKASDFPTEDWRFEVQQGFDFFAKAVEAGEEWTQGYRPPALEEVVKYYEMHSSASFSLLRQCGNSPTANLQFTTSALQAEVFEEDQAAVVKQDERDMPGIATVEFVELDEGQPLGIICDMRFGIVCAMTLKDGEPVLTRLGKAQNPANARPCDWDQDGLNDLIVSDLGSVIPEDHDRGKLIWLKRKSEALEFEPVVLVEGIGRVADARPGDFDGDGDQDLIVAEFGWRETGSIFMLVNNGIDEDGRVKFANVEVDPRHGTIHVCPTDYDADGDLDFVALLSQEFESVEVFLNDGSGKFERKELWAADTASYGVSGIEIVDLNGDGKQDVLLSNGDTFDTDLVRSIHSVQWLENLGDGSVKHHQIAKVPGVYRARAGDLDGDGDLDIVASVFMNERTMYRSGQGLEYDTLTFLEQTKPGVFKRQHLETMRPYHAGFAFGDVNNDQRMDLIVGNFTFEQPNLPTVEIWYGTSDEE